MRLSVPLLVIAILAACTATPDRQAANVNLSGFPPTFKDGYVDGCRSTQGSARRDDKRFKADPHYAQGWRDGADICRRRNP